MNKLSKIAFLLLLSITVGALCHPTVNNKKQQYETVPPYMWEQDTVKYTKYINTVDWKKIYSVDVVCIFNEEWIKIHSTEYVGYWIRDTFYSGDKKIVVTPTRIEIFRNYGNVIMYLK